MPETDPWADLADDIRRAAAGAGQAEARVAGLEADLERHRDALRDLLAVPALGRGGYCAACDCASAYHEEDCPVGDAHKVLETGVASARTEVLADTRVAELEAEAKALADDRGKLMRAVMREKDEAGRLRDACAAALQCLCQDFPYTAADLLEKALADA